MTTFTRNTRTMSGAARTGLAIAMMLAASFTAAYAQDDNAEIVMPTQLGYLTFGLQGWDQDNQEAKYREFQDIARGPLLESFLWRDWGAPTQWTILGSSAVRNDQFSKIGMSRGARLRVDLEYQRTPHLYSQVAQSSYRQGPPGTYLLPDTLQRTNQENPTGYIPTMTDLLSTAPRIPLDARTDNTRARIKTRPATGWTLQLRGEDRHRTGSIAYGGTFGFSNAVELAAPVDHRTVDAEASGQYSRDRINAEVAVGMSAFENRVSTMIWDNPRRYTDAATTGSSRGQMDLAPDNQTVYGRLAFGMRLAPTTMVSATGSMSVGEQDDDFLPFTINSAIPQGSLDSLPARSANAKFVRTTADLRLTTRPLTRLGGTLRLRHHRYDNQTDEHSLIGQVAYDQTWQPGEVHSHAFGNQQTEVGGDIDFDVTSWLDLTGLLEYRQREHTEREVEKDAESVFGLEARARPGDALTLKAGFRHGNREFDEFHESHYQDDTTFFEQPDLRRFDVANRVQDLADASLGWMAGDNLELTVDYTYMNNDFPDSHYGLQSEIEHLAIGAATIQAGPNGEITGGYGFSRKETRQQSNESNPPVTADALTDWQAKIRDENWYVFAHAGWWAVPRRVQFTADYTMSRDVTAYDLSNGAGTAQDLPNTYYNRTDLLLQAIYRMRHNLDITARYRFDQYRVDDLTTENIPLLGITGTAATAIYLGDSIQDYNAHLVALVATKRF